MKLLLGLRGGGFRLEIFLWGGYGLFFLDNIILSMYGNFVFEYCKF